MRKALVVGLAVALLASLGTSSGAQPIVPEGLGEQSEALLADAAEYAEAYNVPLTEAVARLSRNDEIAGFIATAERVVGKQAFGGAWVENSEAEQTLVVAVTSADAGRQLPTALHEVGLRVELVDLSLAELLSRAESVSAYVRATGDDLHTIAGVDVDIRAGLVEVVVADAAAQAETRITVQPSGVAASQDGLGGLTAETVGDLLEIAGVPVRLHIVPADEEGLSADIYGGLALSTCTSGFVLMNLNTGKRRLSTAGHCSNSKSYLGVNLPHKGESWGGNRDVQWHTTPGFSKKPWVYDGLAGGQTPNYRVITGESHRNNMYVGQWVCGYGKTTGFGCGDITTKWYEPQTGSPPTAWIATFIRVSSPTGVDLSSGGDSGGPWFIGGTALGMNSHHVGNDAIYWAVNYLPSKFDVDT